MNQATIEPIANHMGLVTSTLSDNDVVALESINKYVNGDINKVRQLEQKLGSTSLGERRIDKLYRYVKLQQHVPS